MRRHWNRFLSCLLAAALLLASAPAALAETMEVNGFLSNEMGMITGYQGKGGDVVVPAQNQYGGDIVEFEDTLEFNRQSGAISAYAVEAGSEWFQVRDGVLFNYGGDELISYPKASSRTEYTIPEGVTWVRDGAFLGAKNLKSVTFPSGAWCGMGDYAFADCTSLTGVTFQAGCKADMGEFAFSHCSSLTSLVLPSGTEIVGAYALDGCTALATLGIPGTVVDIVGFGGSASIPNVMVTGIAGSETETYCKYANIPFHAVEDYDAFFTAQAAVTSGQTVPIPAEQPSAWAVKDVIGARAANLIPDGLDGGYTQNITRGEFCALACAYADAMALQETGSAASFSDTADPTILRAASLGVITGYADGTFGPGKSIRRDEAAATLARCAKLSGETPNAPARTFADGGSIGSWARADVDFVTGCVVAKTGVAVMNGTSATAFGPTGSYTREQAFATFYRLWRYATEERVELTDANLERPIYMDCTVVVQDDRLILHNAPAGTYHFSFLGLEESVGKTAAVGGDGSVSVDLSGLANGRYLVMATPSRAVAAMRTVPEGDGIFAPPGGGGFDPGAIVKAGGNYYWAAPPHYAENLRLQAEEDKKHPPEACLGSDGDIQEDDPAIRALAAEITAGMTDDYAKALAIHDWVCENISYDVDTMVSTKSGVQRAQDAAAVLESRLAVCQGYSCLTAALLRAAGIPARVVIGYAGGADTYEYWPPAELGQENHAWNEAWIGGRWVLIDATWDCGKKKVGHHLPGQYAGSPDYDSVEALLSDEERPTAYTYFDPDPMVFAAEHRTVTYSLYGAEVAAAGDGGALVPEGPYWTELTLAEADALMKSAKTAGNAPFLLCYYSRYCGYSQAGVPRLAEFAAEHELHVLAVDEYGPQNEGNDAYWGIWDYYEGGITWPVLFWYGGAPETVVTQANVYTLEGIEGFFTRTTLVWPSSQEPSQPSGHRWEGRDAPSAWAEDDVSEAIHNGLLPLDLAEDFHAPITRGEFCALVCAYADAMDLGEGEGAASFPDTGDPAVLRAARLGVVTGYADGSFGPGGPIRRDEAAAMLARCARLSGLGPNVPEREFPDAAGWASAEVSYVTSCIHPSTGSALMNGTGGGFSPEGIYTREQAACTFYRLWRYARRDASVLVGAEEPLPLYGGGALTLEGRTLTATGGLIPVLADGWTSDDGTLDLSGLGDGRHRVELWRSSGDTGTIPAGAAMPSPWCSPGATPTGARLPPTRATCSGSRGGAPRTLARSCSRRTASNPATAPWPP